MPFMSTFAGTPPGVTTISFPGLPEFSTSRPPTWNEPTSRSAIGAWAQPETIQTARLRIARTADPPFQLLGFARQFFKPHDFHGERGGIRSSSRNRLLRARDLVPHFGQALGQVVELAPALIAGAEPALRRAHRDIGISGAAVGVAALVVAKGLQALVAAREIALGPRRDVVLGAGAAAVAEPLERPADRAVLEANRVPVGVQALVLVQAGAGRENQEFPD